MERLSSAEGTGARALEFTILTAARSGEVRGMTWSEVDLDARVWTVPAGRMKTGREHRVPLSDAARRVLNAATRREGIDLVFPAPRGGPMSDMTLAAVLKRMEVDATVHGVRSVFRDWASERTDTPREVAEMALSHTIRSKVEAAYRRGDLLDKRRGLMERWAAFATGGAEAKVVPIRG
jgi:integrase